MDRFFDLMEKYSDLQFEILLPLCLIISFIAGSPLLVVSYIFIVVAEQILENRTMTLIAILNFLVAFLLTFISFF